MKRNIYAHALKVSLLILGLFSFASMGRTQIAISGKLETSTGSPMQDFAVLISGTENKVVYTNSSGVFTDTLPTGGTYNIRPLSCDGAPLNGTNSFDWELMMGHITGTFPLNSPYKIIAADVDNSGSVNLLDTMELLHVLSGLTPKLSGGNFRFVQKNYVFPNPQNPFNPAFPQTFTLSNLQAPVNDLDFIGLKMGDVNNSAVFNNPFLCQGEPEFPATIFGKVFQDANLNCQPDSLEPGMQGWTISASDGTNTFWGTSDAIGFYSIGVYPGVYDVVLSNPDGLWGGCPDTIYDVVVNLQNIELADFGLQPEILCPSMQVDLSTNFLRRCFSNTYYVQYCNTGTVLAENARIEIAFDTFFNILSSSLPWTAINGNTYTFQLGDVPSGFCDQFVVHFELSCDAVFGQTHCTEANIFPDTNCTQQAWNGAELRVNGYCAGNEVKFVIHNKGGDMLTPSNYIVVEDILVMTPPINNPFTLQGGNSEIITVPANGATWRLEAEQPEGYPWGQVASATVEGCGTNANGTFSTGFVNRFPQDDQAPIVDIDCQENVGSFDPNDKQGFPVGVMAEHYIPLEQPIEYLIRFQNTGTDTAFTVKVLDTLDADLDLTTFRKLGSSHPYTFQFLGQNVAEFVFKNILLPDSNRNEPASHGFLKFNIAPQKGLSNGTLIENQAAIYFDFNEPVITNKTWHTLGEKYLGISNIVFSPGISLDVFPNPASDQVTFLLNSASPLQGQLNVFDLQGRLVATQVFKHNQFIFNANELPSGCYFFKLTTEEQVLAAGKLLLVAN